MLTYVTATKSRTAPELSSPDALRQILGAQLQVCILALESKAPDVVLGALSHPFRQTHVYPCRTQRKQAVMKCGRLSGTW
jgi:hypothetical protein